MKDITEMFGELYLPKKALLLYHSEKNDNFYLEAHDLNEQGEATNVHPLSEKECQTLGELLKKTDEKQNSFLSCRSLLGENVLYLKQGIGACAIWYTPKMSASLFFSKSLGLEDGVAELPPLLWKADRQTMWVWALSMDGRPQAESTLYHAPFFNIYGDGKVCMGSVRIEVPGDSSIEGFIALWQTYFFASTFSHLLGDCSPVQSNIIQLWQKLIGTGKPFPLSALKKTKLKLKDLLL
jgi:PRTRC genetic system protein B